MTVLDELYKALGEIQAALAYPADDVPGHAKEARRILVALIVKLDKDWKPISHSGERAAQK